MEFYIPTILAGTLLVALTGWLMPVEAARRKAHFHRRYHTEFVALETNQARKLYRSHYIIGRRKRRCDIHIKGEGISKVHAVLWHDGSNFCIAPSRDLEILKPPPDGALPAVYVNGELVPEEGVVLQNCDRIRMGNSHFMLKDTDGKEDE